MGLAVSVGALADLNVNDEEGAQWLRESIAKVNEVLVENNLTQHIEPENISPMSDRTIIGSFPYSFLHYLRRAYAHWQQDPNAPLLSCSPDEDPGNDSVVEEQGAMLNSHLLCHSDCEGFYIPIPFEEVLVDDKGQERIAGGLLCSSYKLFDELKAVAPSLGIQLKNGELVDQEVEKIGAVIEVEGKFWIERCVWLTLFEAARLSIEHKTAICFG